jgi:spermidine synthase
MKELFKNFDYATDKLSAHSYIPVYERLFQKRKDKVFHVLEIGIGSGGSLRLWNDYFNNADVYGIDLNYIHADLDRFPRIHQIKDDAYTIRCVQDNFVSKNINFDIIIDDGPHNKLSQMMTMQMYFPLLTNDGIIVIEDVQDYLDPGTWIKDIIESLPDEYQEYAEVIDLRHFNKSPDDMLIVLDKSRISIGPQ